MRLLPRKHMVIQSAWLVRVLATGQRWHHCRACGSRMFVKAETGLCPVCLTQKRRRHDEIERIAHHHASAALTDWSGSV